MEIQFDDIKFAKKILEGVKCLTIRRDIQDKYRVGQRVEFVYNNRIFAKSVISKIYPITIYRKTNAVYIDYCPMDNFLLKAFIFFDGFDTISDFINYFLGKDRELDYNGKVLYFEQIIAINTLQGS
jgi:hypothetical protein